MSVDTKGGPSGPPKNNATSEMDTDSAIVNNKKNSDFKLISVSELSPDNEGQYAVVCWYCEKTNVIQKFHEWQGLQTKIKQLTCKLCNKRSAVKCFIKTSVNISNGHLVNSANEINIYSCNINFCKINKIDCFKCKGQLNVKYMPIIGLESEENVTCECGTVNKVVSKHREVSRNQSTRVEPLLCGPRRSARQTQCHAFDSAIVATAPSAVTAQTKINVATAAARTRSINPAQRARMTGSVLPRADSATQADHATAQARTASPTLVSQRQSVITTSNRFFSLSTEEEHKNQSEREKDHDHATFTSPKLKKRKRSAVTPNPTVTQREPRVTTSSSHIPDIVITDVKKINDPEYLSKIRKIITAHGARHAMASNKRTITVRVYTADMRKIIIEEFRKLDDGLRFVARVPKAQQTHQTKVVLITNIYDETNEACLEEMERCIGVRPIKMTTIKGNLQLFIFDGAHSYDEIATLMKTTKHAYFGAFSMKPQKYKNDPKRVVQCKKCFLFTHATSACHGEKKPSTSTIKNEEGIEIEICIACKKPGHGANQAKCEKFQKAVERQLTQYEEKERKKRDTAERRYAALKYRQENVSYANITSTVQFPSLPKQAPQSQPLPPSQRNGHTTNNDNNMEPLGQELQITMKQILHQLQLQHEILIKILNK